MFNNITKTQNYGLSTVGVDQDQVAVRLFRDSLMGVREDSNISIIDKELYEAFKRGIYILKNETYANGVYGVTNSSVRELHDGMVIILLCTADNTGAVSLDIANLGAGTIPMKKMSATNLVDLEAGDLKAKTPTILIYDTVNACFVLVANPVKTASTTQAGITMLSSALNLDSESIAATAKAVKVLSDTTVKASEKGAVNGVAQLGSDSKLVASQIPTTIAGSVKYIGTHSASGGVAPASPKDGNMWKISAGGTIASQAVNIGDYILYQGGAWHRIQNFGDTFQTKLNGIAAGAEVNVQADWNVTDINSDAYIKNKPVTTTQINLWT